jgi:hypothetical protein
VTTSPLTVRGEVIAAVVAETARYGSAQLETGGFLIAQSGTEDVCGAAMAGDAGILRRHNAFQISERALDRLFTYASENDLWLPIQFHTHEFGSGMSETDALHGLRTEGFISAILPRFASPTTDLAEWGWWQFLSGGWRTCLPALEVPGGPDMLVTFDEVGVRVR